MRKDKNLTKDTTTTQDAKMNQITQCQKVHGIKIVF